MPKVYQRAAAERDLVEQFVYRAEDAGLDIAYGAKPSIDQTAKVYSVEKVGDKTTSEITRTASHWSRCCFPGGSSSKAHKGHETARNSQSTLGLVSNGWPT
jgi:hypothetical protein